MALDETPDPDLIRQYQEALEEEAALKAALESYPKRIADRITRRNKKAYRDKKKLYNDPYEVDQYKAMKNDTSKHKIFMRDDDNVKPKKQREKYMFNFPIIRELDPPLPDGIQMVFKEWLLRDYAINSIQGEQYVELWLELLPLCEEKQKLEVSYTDAMEILYRRCFTKNGN